MPAVSYDASSFTIDGRRRWLVSGSIDYTRLERADWARRARLARQMGLTGVSVAVPWALHEPTPGRFDFNGRLDLAAFLEALQAEKLLCILRVGPFIDHAHDLGGLPAWLLAGGAAKALRSGAPAFLEPASRWISALMNEVGELQSGGRPGGPIALVQVEHQWFCGDESAGRSYLLEIGRYLRENGLSVPLINTNHLYQSTEGELDGWTARDHLFSVVRQLQTVRPDAPRIIVDLELTRPETLGPASPTGPLTPRQAVARAAEVIAAGGQFSVTPFAAGTHFAFQAGRAPQGDGAGYLAARSHAAAPLDEAGEPGPLYAALKRICTFTSSFERLFTALDTAFQPAALGDFDPGEGAAPRKATPTRIGAVVHRKGAQGSVVFVFGEGDAPAPVVLPDGSALPVHLGGQGVVWIVLDALLHGRSRLDYSSLCVFASVGRTLVVFGPPGAEGRLSINGAAFEPRVPEGPDPLIEVHEGITVVCASHAQIDGAVAVPDAVFLGCAGLSAEGAPLAHPDFKACLRIDREGAVHKAAVVEERTRASRAPSLGNWARAGVADLLVGESDRYATIDGPEPIERLGVFSGYAWLRIRLNASAAKRIHAGFFESGDRLALFHEGEPCGVVGEGPGASGLVATLSLKKGANTIVALVDVLGRFSSGLDLAAPRGVYGHAWQAKPIRAGKPAVEVAQPIDPIAALGSPLWGVHAGDRTAPQRVGWTIVHKKKSPIAMTIDRRPPAPGEPGGLLGAVVLLNGEPFAPLADGVGLARFVFHEDKLSRGKNVIQLAPMHGGESFAADIAPRVEFYECEANLTEKAQWALASWGPPAAALFEPLDKPPVRTLGVPTWWRCTFPCKSAACPLYFEAAGLTKGQLFLNGQNLCRYFVATADGKDAGPQLRYILPAARLREGENELVIFDEHGAAPSKVRLTTGA